MAQINEIIRIRPRPVSVGQQSFILVIRIRHSFELRIKPRVGVLGELDAFFLPMVEAPDLCSDTDADPKRLKISQRNTHGLRWRRVASMA